MRIISVEQCPASKKWNAMQIIMGFAPKMAAIANNIYQYHLLYFIETKNEDKKDNEYEQRLKHSKFFL